MQGRVLSGRYRLLSELGQGGMASVWRAEHLTLRSQVAVKLMDPAIASTPEGEDRFRREAQAAASLRSAHVVQVLDYGVDEDTPFLVMELLRGESLAQRLERSPRLSPEHTLSIMIQVGRAIARAHAANIVHRDLKPDNIFLVQEEGQELVKVLDFGIAKTKDPSFEGVKTRTGVTMGTPHYMSPEQAEGKRQIDLRTDVWSMGVIACECITGERPFTGETWGELLLNICARPMPVPSTRAPVPPGFDAWFARATARDPNDRFSSVQELVTALQAVVQPLGPKAGSGTVVLLPKEAAEVRTDPGFVPPTGAARPVTGSTGRALEVPTTQRSLSGGVKLLLALLAFLLPAGAAAAYFMVQELSGAPAEASAEPSAQAISPPAEVTPPPPDPTPPAIPIPDPPEVTPAAPEPPAPVEKKPAAKKPSGNKPAPSAEPGPARRLLCYTDAFTGTVRLAGSSRPPTAKLFPCKQNAFSGQYQKL